MSEDWRTQNFSKLCNCGECGKQIFIPVIGYWVYKRTDRSEDGGMRYFCGWNCMRKYDRELEEKRMKRSKRKRVTVNRGW